MREQPDMPIVVRQTTAALHNRLANLPEIRPTLGYHDGVTDVTELLDHPDAYVLLSVGDGVAAIFEWSAPNVWQSHSMVATGARGRQAIAACRAMCLYMFEVIGARFLWGMTPLRNRAACMFNALIGFKKTGEMTDAANVECGTYEMERFAW